MDGVVAVVDVGATIFTKLDLELNATTRPESPDVLALQVLGVGERSATTIHGDTFFEVKVESASLANLTLRECREKRLFPGPELLAMQVVPLPKGA